MARASGKYLAHDNEVDSSVSPVARSTAIPDRCPPYPRTLGIIFHTSRYRVLVHYYYVLS